jgi:hypothetical protein
MKTFCIAATLAAVTLLSWPAGVVLAQNTPNTGTETITGAPATAAPATGTPETGTPAAAPAATTTTPPAATAATTTTTTTEPAKGPKKKKVARINRQREIERSIDNGTVPARYRNSVPREYQQYIPFEKR